MNVELGHLALWLATAMALLQLVSSSGALLFTRQDFAATARLGAWLQFLLLLVAAAALARAFLIADFSTELVTGQIRTIFPAQERLLALLTSRAGALLTALIFLAGIAAWFACPARMPVRARQRLLLLFGAAGLAGALALLGPLHAFARILPVPTEGQGVNMLVSSPAMLQFLPLLLFGTVAILAGGALWLSAGKDAAPGLLRVLLTLGWAALAFWGACVWAGLPDPLFTEGWRKLVWLTAGLWTVAAILLLLLAGRLQLARRLALFRRSRRLTAQGTGMALIGLGTGCAVIGAMCIVALGGQHVKALHVGDSLALGGWQVRLADVRPQAGPDWTAVEGQVQIWRGGRQVALLTPQLRRYIGTPENTGPRQIFGGAGRYFDRLHASINDPDSAGRWPIVFGVAPLGRLAIGGVVLVGGGALISLGGPRRLRWPRWHWVQRFILRQQNWQ